MARVIFFGLRSRLLASFEAKITDTTSHHGAVGSITWRSRHCLACAHRVLPDSIYQHDRKYKSTRIVSEDFDGESDEKSEDYFIDPQSRRIQSKNVANFGREADDDVEDNELIYDTRNKYARMNQGKDFMRQSRHERRQPFGQNFNDRDDDPFSRGHMGQYNHGRSDRSSMEDLWNKLNENKVDFSCEPSLEKNLYNEHHDVSNRSEDEVKTFLKTHEMRLRGPNIKKPILNFEESGFSDEIMELLKRMNFDQPTPIQSISWPHALSGSDIVGIAQTGSGKTLSFILPAILHITEQRRNLKSGGPIALVMCPTRELAMQCHSVVGKFGRVCKVRSAVVYGGQSKLIQEQRISHPALDILIATPGRLLDFLTTESISLRRCSYLVLDEADRMLDMGFEPQIRSILGQIRPDRQVTMWSATWPEEIQELASDFLKDYVHLKIGSQRLTANSDVTQTFQPCSSNEKMTLLLDHLRNNRDENDPRKPAKTLVFASTKVMCSRLERMLRSEGIYSGSLHGGKTQMQRDSAMHSFRSGRIPVLVASDVAARGLDVTDVEYVVNYDLPNNIENYVHRIGRTARAGRKGTALSFITVEDLDMMKPLIDMLKAANHEVPDVMHQLLQKREQLKAYRKRDRVNQNYMGRSPRSYRF